ncbi:MAG: glycosyltransferase WbuB, partial [Coriobacteriia bacterium]|nr:glycosyltransferase WbuB [Coriobacteriia bacterium]
MRVLVVCQHYWPEPFNTSDVCEGLVRRGHEVTVLTGLPNTGMPDGDIPAEWHNGENRVQEHNGVRILRAPLHPRKSGAGKRILNSLSY